MTFLGYAFMFGFALSLAGAVGMHGYLHGHQRGYRKALKDVERESDWWRDSEEGVEEARKRIWREEEPLEGRWP
jgi:hypothetical protein